MIGPTAGSADELAAVDLDKRFEELIAEAAATPPGAGSLVALRYFAGERTPIWDPDVRRVIAGLTFGHSRAHRNRAMLGATGTALGRPSTPWFSRPCKKSSWPRSSTGSRRRLV